MKMFLFLFILITVMAGCKNVQKVDLILHKGKIYTVDDDFSIAEAVAVKDGKIVAVGSDEEILQNYEAEQKKDLQGKALYPGFIDAHCHFYWYGKSLFEANLFGTRSFEEVLEKATAHHRENPSEWLIGRGWDQNDWQSKKFPDKKKLDSLFPDTPVLLTRIDGHAALANQAALDAAGITAETQVEGGKIETKNDTALTGMLIDNAIELVRKHIPAPAEEDNQKYLLKAQENCFAVGLTSLVDAGLEKNIIDQIDALQNEGLIKMRLYVMLSDNDENRKHYFNNGIYKTERLHVRGFKFYSDGALGSRGAKLLEPYTDSPDETGLLLNDRDYFRDRYQECYDNGFQVHTHAIGDSANRMVLSLYAAILDKENDRRWRIEHCQVIHEDDFEKFGKYSIIPSVQPTHTTSDMYWAEDRLGVKRIKGAYAFKKLLDEAGVIAAGSDFPIEDINPLYGFYAAVARKDQKGYPPGGFQKSEALTRKEALKAMTIWAAYSVFEEKEKGSIEPEKHADFVILDEDIMEAEEDSLPRIKVLSTYINGEVVFDR